MKPNLRWTSVVLASALLAAACGGSDAPPTPLAITTPPASATAAEGAVAQFSVVAQGTGSLAYQWNQGSSPLSGATSASLTVGPLQLSDHGKTFSVSVSDALGTQTSGSATLSVTPRAWSSQVQSTGLGSETRAVQSVSVADAQSRISVAFQGPSGTAGHTALHLGRIDAGSSTLTSENLSSAGHGPEIDAVDARIAVDASGRTLVVWTAFDPVAQRGEIYAAFKGWGAGTDRAATRISTAGIAAQQPDVVAAADGSFEVLWTERSAPNSSFDTAIARRYHAGTNSWDAPQPIEATAGPIDNARLASNGQGLVWAVWQGDNNGTAVIQANARSAGANWNPAGLVTLASNQYTPQVKLDSAGHGVITALDAAGRVYAHLLDGNGVWSSAGYVANHYSGRAPAVALHASGRVAIASFATGTTDTTLYHWGYDPTSQAWSSAAVVATAAVGAAIRDPQIGFDAAGNQLVLWSEAANHGASGGIVRARRWIGGGIGWLATVPVVSIDDFIVGQYHFQPSLGMAADGSALAFWFKIDAPGGNSPLIQQSKYSLLR